MDPKYLRFEPMNIGTLLDRVFRLYAGNFPLLLGIVAIAFVPAYIVQIGFQTMLHTLSVGQDPVQNSLILVPVGILVVLILHFIATCLSQGAATYAVSRRYLGHEVSIEEAYRMAGRRFWTLVNTMITVGIRLFLGFLLFIIPGIYLMVRYIVPIPIVMLEGATARDSISRSSALTQGHWWRIFGIIVVILLLQMMVSGTANAVAAVVLGSTPGAYSNIIIEAVGSLVALVLQPIMIIAGILIYYDLRIRKEGFDLEMLSQSLHDDADHSGPSLRSTEA